jgi:hypothetical protein
MRPAKRAALGLAAAVQRHIHPLRRQTPVGMVALKVVEVVVQQATQKAAQVVLATFQWSGLNEYICPNY